MLEKIAGVDTKQLISMSDDQINGLVKILQDNLGWGDGLGFGQKTKEDLDKLVNNIFQEDALKKTGGNKCGQAWHNIKNGVMNALGIQTIDKCNTPEEITEYFKAKYLQDIDKLSKEEKEKKYKELLTAFFYNFNSSQSDNNKKIAMVQAIKTLAAQDRAVMTDIMEKYFSKDSKALEPFAEALNDNRVEIVTSTDALGNNVTKEDATNIAHIAYKHMSEEDVKQALVTLKNDAQEFYKQYGEQIKDLQERVAKGETLTKDEQELLDQITLIKNNVYVAGYSGAVTGTVENANIQSKSKKAILTTISNDTKELGIQEEVLQNVSEYIEEHPDAISISKEELIELIDEATDNAYSAQTSQTQDSEITSTVQTSLGEDAASTVDTAKVEQDSIGIGYTFNGVRRTESSKELVLRLYTTDAVKEYAPQEKNKCDTAADIIQALNQGDTSNFYKVMNEVGSVKQVVAVVLNNIDTVRTGIAEAAKNIYQRCTNMQSEILRILTSSAIEMVSGLTTNMTWQKSQNTTYASYAQTKLIQENAKEALEENTEKPIEQKA